MSIDLWVSIAVAIPLAIIANIGTPKVQKWLDSRTETSKIRKTESEQKDRESQLISVKKEMEDITKLHDDKTALIQEHLHSLIKISLYGAFGSIYGGIFSFVGEVGHWDGVFGLSGRLGTQIVALMVGMLIYITCAKAMRIHRKVKEFETYKAESERIINELEKA